MNKKIDDIRKRLGNLTKTAHKLSLENDLQRVPISIGSDSSPKRTGVGIEIRARSSFSKPIESTLMTHPDDGIQPRILQNERLIDTQDMLSTARPILGEQSKIPSGPTLLRDLNNTEFGGNLLSPRDFPSLLDPKIEPPSVIFEQQPNRGSRSKKSILSHPKQLNHSQNGTPNSKQSLWKRITTKINPITKIKAASVKLFNLLRTLQSAASSLPHLQTDQKRGWLPSLTIILAHSHPT